MEAQKKNLPTLEGETSIFCVSCKDGYVNKPTEILGAYIWT
jgi:hypothetical protein